MRSARSIAAIVIALGLLATVEAMRSSAPQQAARFAARVDGVRLHVAVIDNNRPVTGLRPADFVVTDNGVRQEVDLVSAVDGLAVALVVDHSETVGVAPLAELITAARLWLDALESRDTVALLTFTDRLNHQLPAGSDPAAVRAVLAQLVGEPMARTALWDAMSAGASLVADAPGRPVVAVVSDGCDNASWLTPTQATTWLGRSEVTVDLLSWGLSRRARQPRLVFTGSDVCFGPLEWGDVAKATGGEMFQTDRPDLAKMIAARASALRSGYFITYTPTGVKQDDGWHKVEVRLQGVRGRVTTRDGYYAGGSE